MSLTKSVSLHASLGQYIALIRTAACQFVKIIKFGTGLPANVFLTAQSYALLELIIIKQSGNVFVLKI